MTDKLALHLYRAPSGQWAGVIYDEVARIGGCASPEDVRQAALEQFPGIEALPSDAPHGVDDDGPLDDVPHRTTKPHP